LPGFAATKCSGGLSFIVLVAAERELYRGRRSEAGANTDT
jgi:hypothetical protein